MSGADPSSEVEGVQLSGLNDDSVAFDAADSPHNSTGNKTNASGPSQSRYIDFEQLITESNILPFKLPQAQPSQQTPMPRSEISGNHQDLEEETLGLGGEDISSHVPIQLCQKIWDHQYINIALLLKGNIELQDLYTGGWSNITETGHVVFIGWESW